MFVPALKFIFGLSLSGNTFHNLQKQAAISPVFEKGIASSTASYRPLDILIFLSLSYIAMSATFENLNEILPNVVLSNLNLPLPV
jgi:hypothetical protein